MESLIIKMAVITMKVNGLMIKRMAKENYMIKIITLYMMEILRMIKQKEM